MPSKLCRQVIGGPFQHTDICTSTAVAHIKNIEHDLLDDPILRTLLY